MKKKPYLNYSHQNADTALYQAKNSGKGRVIIYSDDREFAMLAM